MRSNKIIIAAIITVAAITLAVILTALYLSVKDDGQNTETEESVTETNDSAYVKETLDTTPKPVPELDEGNEIYLDSDVIARLTEMELYGEEDLVNAILDGEMVIINSFVNKEYSLRAVRQAQRFYFHFYDELKDEKVEDIINKLTSCFTSEGVFEDTFPVDAQRLFGFDVDTDYSYIFDTEDSQ